MCLHASTVISYGCAALHVAMQAAALCVIGQCRRGCADRYEGGDS